MSAHHFRADELGLSNWITARSPTPIDELAGVEAQLRTLLAALPDLPPLLDDDLGVDPDDEPDSVPLPSAWAEQRDDGFGETISDAA